MFFLIKTILLLLPLLNQAERLKLQGAKPLYMNCMQINERDNGFVGSQYFYESLSQSENLVNLDKITYTLWINIYQKPKLTGRQILFAFVDGNTNNPYLNLMLYYQSSAENYNLTLSNSKYTSDILNLTRYTDLQINSWYHIVVSIDQSTSNTFINLKFFSTYNWKMNSIQDTLVNQKLKYNFGVHSRITNEQLYKSSNDYKACVNIANFYYINGWTTMDSDIYLDYDLELKFFLKPYQLKGLNVSDQYMNVNLRKQSNPIFYSDSIGLLLFKNTQIVYTFMEDLVSLTMMFWIKPQNIVSLFQFISLTDDVLKQVSLGFGVNFDYKLQFHQNYGNSALGLLTDSTWAHVTAGVLELSYDANFIPTNQKKLLTVYIDDNQVQQKTINNVIAFKRLILGPTATGNFGAEMIDIQDIRIFKGYGIQTGRGDCLLFVGAFCAFCQPNTHYCKEQDPNDDIIIYNCTAGFKETQSGCFPIAIQNCLRQQGSGCINCADNYQLQNGQCQQINPLFSPYNCSDSNAIFCKRNITNPINNKIEQSKLCKIDFNIQNSAAYCQKDSQNNCQQAQFYKKCYKCKTDNYLTEQNTCQSTCTLNNRFQQNQVCLKKCPGKYFYNYSCFNTNSNPKYQCNSANSCNNSEKNIGYYCLNEQEQSGQYQICVWHNNRQWYSRTYNDCDQSCKYCFGGKDTQCLGCYDNKFFSPYDTKCVSDCNTLSLFKYNNRDTMVCELECPPPYLTQGLECVKSCTNGYAIYNNTQCLQQTQVTDNFIETQYNSSQPKTIFANCPQVCQTCTSYTYCTSCLNHYILNQNKCPTTCYPQYLYIDEYGVSVCLINCDSSDYVYDNANIDGYQIRQCFKIKCGSIQINKKQQTYLHQTKPLICVYPCEDQYYAQQNTNQCAKCDPICQNCQNSATFCTKCWPDKFLQDNSCFVSCDSKFKNYINNQCEGSCSSGFTINDKVAGNIIQACVKFCGHIFSQFTYVLDTQCYQSPPLIGAYCIGFQCYNCYYKCKTCSGFLKQLMFILL
ncbi:unnamed protein product (macronuclear) [Paramecium tetraurelia]|uniref:Uncharacterized protein n=1 Tax=Paramecium tetraurelia TaxID=5888 RepID=A0D120_PARTE|nr:uncharacterized protein GSPATT00039152001 [Paramecium tetraurelia]CAK76737.1 unnamed protein product [Paramecium tetraurelia]|eukprot:XP_001444134.1 hypothetical protein (macronuclear) [Paramecium tetraurelia strain d4-2]